MIKKRLLIILTFFIVVVIAIGLYFLIQSNLEPILNSLSIFLGYLIAFVWMLIPF